jgi:uncharacterized protein (DUF697 family)
MEEREAQAHEIVSQHAWWAGALNLIPTPFIGTIANTAIHLKMLKSLSDHYGVDFTEDLGKKLIAALVGGVVPSATTETARSLLRFIPVVGPVLSIVALPALSSATTYAIGEVFVQHFESGGTLLDFDPSKMQSFFVEQYERGKSIVSSKPNKGRRARPASSTT